jgi:mono/diheme cytochrome c family protein
MTRFQKSLVLGLSGACLLLAMDSSVAADAQLTAAQTQFFESKIRPILSENCYQCHSRQAQRLKAGLFLDTKADMLKGGDSGPALVPGDPEKSLVIKAVRYTDSDLQMPPKGKKLSDSQIADLEAWVKMGAPDPRTAGAVAKTAADGKNHWAWKPVKKPAPPEVKDTAWAKTPVDNFILAKLEEKELKPNPQADKRTLIRRATFDLIGIPPTADEVADFLKDESPEAFATVVDRLLASPHYGERWGRHWLDVARYSDTKGMVRRQREDPSNPFAWSYRDYVIRSFNDDKPYNVFVIEQIAVDKLPITAKQPQNLAALGFLTLGERFMGMQNDIINDRIDVVTKGFLALTVTCARCHDHKFDPIPTRDYYSLHGIFASCAEPEVEPVISKILPGGDYSDYYKKRMGLEQQKANLEATQKELRRTRDRQGIQKLQRQFRNNQSEIVKLELTHPGAPERAVVLDDLPKPHDSPVFVRGDAGNKGPTVPRRFPEVLSPKYRPIYTNGSGRLQLAYAVASKDNPVTARVLVNRVWMHHFGEGFVPTPDDFGTMSEAPSHPELLDYLASRFMEQGWSIKKLHREIMLSSVYQESSANNPRFAMVDPNNRLLWRANVHRLEFEALRDSLLAIGGTLDPTMYGRPVQLNKEPYSTRRTIYGRIDRSDVADVLVNFDFANPDLPSGRRHETTVPQQALFLMNSPLVVEQAKNVVALPAFSTCETDEAKINFLYERMYQRPARPEEIALGIEFITQPQEKEPEAKDEIIPVSNTEDRRARKKQPAKQPMRRAGGGGNDFRKRAPLKTWEEYAHALLQGNEASFVN